MKKEDNVFYITNQNNNQIRVKSITKIEFEQYRNGGKLSPEHDLFEKYGVKAYLLQNGEVIVQESSKFAIYPSKESLLTILQTYTGPRSEEILFNQNPFGKEFPSQIYALTRKLATELNVKSAIDSKIEFLKELDQIVLKNRNKEFLDRHILQFIALIGKYLLVQYPKGKWEMKLANDGVTWQPYISIEGKRFFYINYIIEDVMNSQLNTPISETYESVLAIIRNNFPNSEN